MKNIIILSIAFFTTISVKAQDIQASLDAAQSAYSADQSLEARDNLQQALIDINNLLGKEILELMPTSLGGLAFNSKEDNVIGGTGFAGLIVNRTYGTDSTQHINTTIANDSPMLAIVNAFLGNAMLSGLMASQTGQKKVTISGYKGMLEGAATNEEPTVYTLNVPIGDSLFTFVTTGFDNENDVVSMAQQINLDKIVALLK